MAQTIQQALQEASLYNDDLQYRFVQLPAKAITLAAGIIAEAGNPFMALLVDKDEVTLMIEQEDFEHFQKRLRDATMSDIVYRLITFDVELEPTLVGFMAHISTALAEAKISILPFAAYTRDHLFVAEADFDKAMTILKQLQQADQL